jgi:hypothetical protein
MFTAGVFERLAAMKRLVTGHSNLELELDGLMSSFSVNELLTSTGPVLITDQLASPGDFLLHQLLSEYVKNSPDGKCIIVSTSQDLARWKAISSRSVSFFRSRKYDLVFNVI